MPTDLETLFHYNRSVPSAASYARLEAIEKPWIDGLLADLVATTAPVVSRAEWQQRLADLLRTEEQGSPSADYIAEEATYEQFRHYVREFAADGLTEAQNFFPAIARVPIKAQMALMRVLIDEFGCGNLMQSHSYLYLKLLEELDLPTDLDTLVEGTHDETFAFLNIFYWLTHRAPTPEYFLGGLAYLEASIPAAFACLARACERLGIENGKYYTEHIHIDDFHKKEMQTAIREYEIVHGLDATKVWIGALLLSNLLGTAFDAAVDKARSADAAAV
ncbi:MAG: iron-containing redox enzyme family protein [Actinomycetota bacterium]|nr:iron-containing redox enzyme family protein [Actinomycetota bacterium]